MADKVRHVLGISGGKDSSALAIYLRDRVPEMEYFFCDTGAELQETYDYLDRLEGYLGKPIVRLCAERGFDHWLKIYGNFLPSAQARWCTKHLKLEPFHRFVGDDEVVSYVGIRADEPYREGYISHKSNIKVAYPFKEDGIVKADVFRLLEESGVGVPEYYRWRSRSGCYFCFFQRKEEWIGLYDNHPDLFERAKTYEKLDPETGKSYTWSERETLDELITRRDSIRGRGAKSAKGTGDSTLLSLLAGAEEDDPEDQACLICSL